MGLSRTHSQTESRSSKTKKGFALLITIVLVAFLVLILVGLAAFTRVETQVASNAQAMAQARQNALMGMNIALGQLQRYAGQDNRITAQASIKGNTVENPWFTGVWSADAADSPNAVTWLVSGNELSPLTVTEATNLQRTTAAPEQPLTNAANPGRILIVGKNSSRTEDLSAVSAFGVDHGGVVVPAVAIQATVPGVSTTDVVVGRYAWWAGDEGVKASLALPDRADEVTYAPWSTPTQRNRIRQQIGSAPNYFRSDGATPGLSNVRLEGFDPFQNNGGVSRVAIRTQFALLDAAGTAVSPLEFKRNRFHEFTPTAFSVLANTLPSSNSNRGLLRDLSTKPDLLGTAFEKYADYSSYMETPGTTTSGASAAIPAISNVDSPRRRYVTQPPQADAAPGLPEISFKVAPVLVNFYLQFKVQRLSAGSVEVRSRLFTTFWNPYTAALVPPSNLRVTVEGLPSIEIANTVGVGVPGVVTADLNESPVSESQGGVTLPFAPAARHGDSLSGNFGSAGEMASWFPGRVYSWATNRVSPNTVSASTALGFYTNLLTSTGWIHNTRPSLAGSGNQMALVIPSTDLTVKVWLGNDEISSHVLKYDEDSVPDINSNTWAFGYTYRLNQPKTFGLDREWLSNFDPRADTKEQSEIDDTEVFIPFGTQNTTRFVLTDYANASPPITSITGGDNLVGYLLYRVQGSSVRAVSTYNDVSLFELPRLPLLSLGELQHLQFKNERPYSIGNSWGNSANAVFDRFFFSGLPKGGAGALPAIEQGQPLPNWNLKPVNAQTAGDLVSGNPEETAAKLLQAGGFNINSTSSTAWRAVLSSARFSTQAPFTAADILNTGTGSVANAGTQNGTNTRNFTFNTDQSLGTGNSAPVFFRFSQTAQEVFFWERPTGSSNNDRKFSASAFRQGVRGFYSAGNTVAGEIGAFNNGGTNAVVGSVRQHVTTDQIEVLAQEIVKNIRTRAASKGPFRSMEEFLSETSVFGGVSLLEKAIEYSGINAAEVKPVATAVSLQDSGLSALTLTQADLLTATAPYLRTRSDTFLVRSYGEYINPATQQAAGRAWAEATVQRFPETVNPSDSILQPNAASDSFGRRFKIISFRWLTESDI